MLATISRHKYKLAIFGLLAGASVVSVILAQVRIAYSGTHHYYNLVWNLFLAWIPFIFASIAYAISWSRKSLYFVVPICALIWLVFFPNAPYILTDFQLLSDYASNAPLWYDVLMVIWFAWTGLFLGVVSLYLMQEIVTRAFGRVSGWVFVLIVTVLSSIGIFLGRFYRWNSWDVLGDPLPIAHDILGWLKNPFANLRVYGFTLLFTLLFLFIYLTIHSFGRIMQERPRRSKESHPLIPLDYHIHTCFSFDSSAVPEAMCRRAVELGIAEIGFSEHWDVGPYEEVTRFLQPQPWWQEIQRLRRLFSGQLTIRTGIEIAEPHLYPADTAAILASLPFDYVLGSVHFVGPHMMFDPKYFSQCTADEIYLPYFAELQKMVRQADVDIVAHFDIPSRTGIPIFGYEVARYEEPIRAALSTVIERGLALDVNLAGLRKPANNLMPAPLILKWYRQMGGERLTLGSDAHAVDQLGLNLNKALQAIHEAGFTHLTQYKSRQPHQIAIP